MTITSKCSLFLITALVFVDLNAMAFDGPATSPEKEQELLAVLRSDAAGAKKALACKNLAIYGSDLSVVELAKLLSDPQLSSWSRIALEAIPGDAADGALRDAAESLQGRILIGVINSIGVKRDPKAVDALTAKLTDSNSEVAAAAAVALGRIGNAAATNALQAALTTSKGPVQSAVAEGCILCAERLHVGNDAASATKIYDVVRGADVPMQRIIEATRGAILARGQDGLPLLLETFQSPDRKLFRLALGTVREFPGAEIDKALTAQLESAAPERALLIVQAMADRPETVVLSAVLAAASEGDKRVRLSAIDALQRVGDDSCLSVLLDVSADSDEELSAAALNTLAGLSGDKVDSEIVAQLSKATSKNHAQLLSLVGQRRIDAVPVVLKALNNSNADIRAAALAALGETVALDQLDVLISQVIAPRHTSDVEAAQKALRTASVRMPDREACAAELETALRQAPAASKSTILEILSDVGGKRALSTLATAAKSGSDKLQDTSSRLLGKLNSVTAAPVLLDLAKTAPAEKYRVRALRGYIGLARKFAMSDAQRADMCQNALAATRRESEHKLVIDVLKLHPGAQTLKVALKAAKLPGLKNDATAAAMVIAQKVGGKGLDVSRLLAGSGLDPVKLEIISAHYGAGRKQKDVTAVIKKQAGNLPLITLTGGSYNASFGGDPASGVVKQLKIRYRMNGTAGEAAFAENALILLPTPK